MQIPKALVIPNLLTVTEFLQGRAQGYIFSKGIPSSFCCTKISELLNNSGTYSAYRKGLPRTFGERKVSDWLSPILISIAIILTYFAELFTVI